MNERNVLGNRIKLVRIDKNLTQEQLAARLNVQGIDVDRPMISRIETQTRNLLDYEIIGIANALGIDVKELFHDDR